MSTIELVEKLTEMLNATADMDASAMDKALTSLCESLNITKPFTFENGQTYEASVIHTVSEAIVDAVKINFRDTTEIKQWK